MMLGYLTSIIDTAATMTPIQALLSVLSLTMTGATPSVVNAQKMEMPPKVPLGASIPVNPNFQGFAFELASLVEYATGE